MAARPAARAFLEAQVSYVGGYIPGVVVAILDGVTMAAQRETARFERSPSDLGVSLADFGPIESLLLKLSSTTLRKVTAGSTW